MARGERGYSVVELTAAAGLFFIVLTGALVFFAAQSRLEWISRGQYDVQTAANRVLDNLVEGERRTWDGAEVRGLRYASGVAIGPEGICFRTRDHIVTYYRQESTLCRRVDPATPGPLEVTAAGGTLVLEHVTFFSASSEEYLLTYPDGSQTAALAVTLELAVRKDAEQDIALSTSVRLRNWAPGP
ncbi:MAG: hypothetical protein RDU89_11335 [bacterium]|nr:hypothetical protein [bacterium]